jgi:hypothetical protein
LVHPVEGEREPLSLSRSEQDLLGRYLLGDLAEGERLDLEQRYLADEGFFEEIQALEDELIRDYLAGHLTATQHQLFERKYLATPALREKVEFVRTVKEAASLIGNGSARPRWGFLQSVRRWLNPTGHGLRAALAAGAVLALAGLAWSIVGVMRLQRDTEGLRAGRTEVPGSRPASSSFILESGRTRGASGYTIRIAKGLNEIEFLLLLDREPDRAMGYRVDLSTAEGPLVWSGEGGAPRALKIGLVIPVRVPVAALATEDYVLSLQAQDSGIEFHTLSSYFFRVVTQ